MRSPIIVGNELPRLLQLPDQDHLAYATPVAFLIDIKERLTDAAREMADKLIGSFLTCVRNAQTRNFAATSGDVARLMSVFGRTSDGRVKAVDNGDYPIDLLDASAE